MCTVVCNGRVLRRFQDVEDALRFVKRTVSESSFSSLDKTSPFFDAPVISIVFMELYERNEK